MSNKIILSSALALTTLLPFNVNVAQAASSKSVKAVVSDTVITAKVKALYAKSALVKALDINVTTVNQNVVLTGVVKTESQYERAITLADTVDGVKSINVENLSVKRSKAPLTDSYTTAKVKSAFLKEKLFGSKEIEVWPVKIETKDSVVYLTGKVHNEKERTNLINLAQATAGVKEVKSAITIQ